MSQEFHSLRNHSRCHWHCPWTLPLLYQHVSSKESLNRAWWKDCHFLPEVWRHSVGVSRLLSFVRILGDGPTLPLSYLQSDLIISIIEWLPQTKDSYSVLCTNIIITLYNRKKSCPQSDWITLSKVTEVLVNSGRRFETNVCYTLKLGIIILMSSCILFIF